MSERHGERPDTPADRPAPTITSKARTDALILHTHTHTPERLAYPGRTRRAGKWTEQGSRSVDEPAPTLAFGHNAGAWGWVLNRRQTGAPVVTPDRPAPTVVSQALAKSVWQWERPATPVCGDPRITARCHHDEGTQGRDPKTTEQVRAGDYVGTEPIKLTVEEALLLQGFPVDYPVQGSRSKKFEQVGNAVPPAVAEAIVRALDA